MTRFHPLGGSHPSAGPLRRMRHHAAIAIALLLAAGLAACGGEKRAATSTPLTRTSAIPEDLKGLWEARIAKGELVVPPDGVAEEPSLWTLKFLGTGGEDDGPSVFLSNDGAGDGAGELVASFSMSGRRIVLGSEPACRTLRFEVTKPVGDAAYPASHKLYLEPMNSSRCPRTPVSSVLTASRWTRPGAPTPEEEWPLERIRDEGSREDRTVMAYGLTAREYVVCDGPVFKCESDPPFREPYEHRALEVTKGGRSALFSPADLVTAFGETSVLAVDSPHETFDPSGVSRYRLLRIDGTEIPLEMVMDPVPAVPDDSVVVIDYSESADPEAVQHAFLVDERKRTLRPLDLPWNGAGPNGLRAGRYWGPNTAESLWFVDVDCRVYWVAGDALQKRRLDCADDFEFNWSNGDFTYVRGDWFPDGWLEPGRMALLERVDDRLILHVSLDRGATWRRIRVRNEDAVPDTLRRIG